MSEIENAQRIGRAVLNGWSFDYFKKASDPTTRNSVYIKKPNTDGWYAEKTNGDIEDWVKSLLDEAGVPE